MKTPVRDCHVDSTFRSLTQNAHSSPTDPTPDHPDNGLSSIHIWTFRKWTTPSCRLWTICPWWVWLCLSLATEDVLVADPDRQYTECWLRSHECWCSCLCSLPGILWAWHTVNWASLPSEATWTILLVAKVVVPRSFSHLGLGTPKSPRVGETSDLKNYLQLIQCCG